MPGSSFNFLLLLMTQKDTCFKTITRGDFRKTTEVLESYRYGDIKRYAIARSLDRTGPFQRSCD
jgi:hypothetical protein